MSERSFEADVRKIQELASDLLECHEMNASAFNERDIRIAELSKERDEEKGQRESWQDAMVTLMAEKQRLDARITELTKERDNASDAATRYLGGANDLRSRIAELTQPRVVDDVLVEEMAKKLFAAQPAFGQCWESYPHKNIQKDHVRFILAALPPNLTQPVELTDEECDRLICMWVDARTREASSAREQNRNAVRALLAAAGRYVAPTVVELTDTEYKTAKAACEGRLPYVGLTKEEASVLNVFLHNLPDPNNAAALRIIVKALGAGGGK